VRKILIIVITAFSLLQLQSQTKQDAISEANRLKISSKQEAINALNSKGISETQIRKIAKLRGIDYDTALAEYLNSGGATKTVIPNAAATDVVTEMKMDTLPSVIVPSLIVKEENKIESYFGYDIFVNNPFGQKEYLLGNIDEGYILAPGDELRITVFGDNNLEIVSKIDLNGNISFPNKGMFFAAGNSFATLKKRVKIFLGKYYSGLLSSPSRSFLDVSLTQIRPVKVSILGNVNTPGPHLVSGMATVLNALYASGGVNTSGTLRDVKVYRNNKLIKTIDLYDYITQGNIDQDIRLSNNDILFVGPRLSSITLSGQVKKSAIYELKPNESLKDLFKFSGGLSTEASLNNVNISRIKPFDDRKQELVFDRFLTTINFGNLQNNKKKNFQLTDGDQVTVKGILAKQKNQIVISGNVNAPGTYALDVFKDLKTLINTGAKGLLPNTYLEKLDINRVDEKGNLSFKTYNLSSVLNDKVTVSLQENDQIKIYSLNEVQGEKTVTISGYNVFKDLKTLINTGAKGLLPNTNVEKLDINRVDEKENLSFLSIPKTVLWKKDLSLFDLIFQSVSFDELEFQAKVLKSRLDLKRYDVNSGLYDLKQYSFRDLETLKNTYLQANDQIVLYTRSVNEDLNPTVSIIGQVSAPGEFSLYKKMYIEDLIISAGGFNDFAQKGYVYVNRLDRDLKKGTYSKLEVNDIDIDYMLGLKKTPSNPFILENYDVVTVVSPIRANFIPRVSVQGEVNFPRDVLLENDKTTISELIDLAGGYTNNYNLESSFVERDSLKLFLNLNKSLLDNKINLQDGDKLTIGSNLASIKTIGGVLNPTVFNWERGKRAKYYLKNSGGKKKRIDYVNVLFANGQSKKVNWFKNPKLYPGSVINVIEKPEKVDDGKNTFMDDFVRIFGILSGALTTIVLVTKL